jgi:shikimate kinase
MGAGKSSVGQALAARLDWHFVDLDDQIQQRVGRSVAEIFAEYGEARFRELERRLLREVLRGSAAAATVLSLGGGAFIDNTNRRLLRENEIRTVFLDAPAEELFRRCRQPGTVRPLLGGRDRFHALYHERRPDYLKAEVCIQTAGVEIASVVEQIISRLGLDAYSGAPK